MNRILILIDHFYPAYKGGGPIQSIFNLVQLLPGFEIYVVTSAYDLNETAMLEGVTADQWNEIELPGAKKVNVWYGNRHRPGYRLFKKFLSQIQPSFVYFNGIFSLHLFIKPLLALRSSGNKAQLIICPRGMLQKGALADKSFKKKTYISLLRNSGLVKKAVWHATNAEEQDDIRINFPGATNIVVAANIPKLPVSKLKITGKKPGELRLVYLSLIAEKKNLHFLLQLMEGTTIHLDIYGPVKDKKYWQQCLRLMEKMPGRVKYCGDVQPQYVQETFERYHALALLTRGENFGHALYECLSAGRPVITSFHTPWVNLEPKHAGWNVDITNFAACKEKLSGILQIDQECYNRYCLGAYELAAGYFSESGNTEPYKKMFSVK